MVKVKYNQEIEEWEKQENPDSEDKMVLTLDGFLIPVLNAVRKDLKRDLDRAICVCGEVGSGKSNLARVCARYVSNENFHPRKHIVRSVDDMKHVFKKAKKGEAVIFDEASGIFSSVDTLTKKTKWASYVLDVCRQKNLFLIIVAPRFHRLKADIALDRTKFLLRAYMSSESGARGPFAFYGGRLKEKLYFTLRKTAGNYKLVRPKFRGTVGEDKTHTQEYLKMKDETLNLALDSFGADKKTPTEIKREVLKEVIKNNTTLTNEELSQLIGVSTRTITRYRADLSNETEENKGLSPLLVSQ